MSVSENLWSSFSDWLTLGVKLQKFRFMNSSVGRCKAWTRHRIFQHTTIDFAYKSDSLMPRTHFFWIQALFSWARTQNSNQEVLGHFMLLFSERYTSLTMVLLCLISHQTCFDWNPKRVYPVLSKGRWDKQDPKLQVSNKKQPRLLGP